jgi:hypothetical protein
VGTGELVSKPKLTLRAVLLLIAIAPFIFTNHASALAWIPTYNYKTLNGTYLTRRVLTPDGTDLPYTYNERTNNVKIAAASTNTGGNLRELFWPANSPNVLNAESCSTWSNQTDGLTQQGAALRIIETPTSMRAVTVTKNIWMGGTWMFNVHVWDTSQPGLNQIAGFDMSEVTGKMWWDENNKLQSNLKPFPWHLCARTIGNKLQLKVWVTSNDPSSPDYNAKQPSWNDAKYVRETQIPDGWVQPGKTGWFIGHINPGNYAEFQGLQTSTGL